MPLMRLDKFLAEMGVGTRSQVKIELKKGLVQVNGRVVKSPETKVDSEKDQVSYKDSPLTYVSCEYYLLHKPAGVISASQDMRETTVVDLITDRKRNDLFPVGRLDRDTEGLLLITNDGELSHHLLHPKKHVDKTYYAKVTGHITEETVRQFAQGLDIGDETLTLPARLEILKTETPEGQEAVEGLTEVKVTIREGRFHQIKRMFEAVGGEVKYLKRLQMGPLELPEDLAKGEYRPLTEEEKRLLGLY